jgi:DNA polymerase-3 subunit delta'
VLSDVVGQDEAVGYLRRVVEGQISSPLLLIGEEGTGRKFAVISAVKELVSKQRGANSSEYVQVEHGVHPDVVVVSAPSDKEIGVDAIRAIVTQSFSYPTSAPYRFFIVDGADRMTIPAANAILKTLEEPPAASRFFMLAESYERVLPTIRSRCGRVPFQKLSDSFIFERISRFESDPDKALVYTRMGEGSVGRAARYWGSNRIAIRDSVLGLLLAGATGDFSSAFASIDELSKELPLAFRFLCFLVHDVLVVRVDPQRAINQDVLEDLITMRNRVKDDRWFQLWGVLKTLSERYESSYVNLSFQLKSAIAAAFCG